MADISTHTRRTRKTPPANGKLPKVPASARHAAQRQASTLSAIGQRLSQVPGIESFRRFYPTLSRVEGGYSNHPSDRGGVTVGGVINSVYKHFMQQNDAIRIEHNRRRGHGPDYIPPVTESTKEERMLIFAKNYWKASEAYRYPGKIGWIVMDIAVNSGPGIVDNLLYWTAVKCGIRFKDIDDLKKYLQSGTLGAEQTRKFASCLLDVRGQYYHLIICRRPDNAVFAAGWNNRLKTLAAAVGLVPRKFYFDTDGPFRGRGETLAGLVKKNVKVHNLGESKVFAAHNTTRAKPVSFCEVEITSAILLIDSLLDSVREQEVDLDPNREIAPALKEELDDVVQYFPNPGLDAKKAYRNWKIRSDIAAVKTILEGGKELALIRGPVNTPAEKNTKALCTLRTRLQEVLN